MGACLIRNAEHPRQQCIFPASGGNKNAPVIEELPISLECKVEEINQYNATLRIVAEIVNVSVDEKILSEDGKIDPEKLGAISYDPANHAYLKLGGKVGTAFSDGNQLK